VADFVGEYSGQDATTAEQPPGSGQ
jgi:hypothetical protein